MIINKNNNNNKYNIHTNSNKENAPLHFAPYDMMMTDFRPTLEDEGMMAKSRISAAKKPQICRPTGGAYGKQNEKKF